MAEIIIRPMKMADIPACAEILCAVYNNDLWQCRWSHETAEAYLADHAEAKRFVGFCAEKEGCIIGSCFAHEKLWWNNTEVFLDEMFVLPDQQNQGVGRLMMAALEEHVRIHHLAGITLTTNRYAPAPQFYRRLGFTDCEHVLFMAKEVPHDPA